MFSEKRQIRRAIREVMVTNTVYIILSIIIILAMILIWVLPIKHTIATIAFTIVVLAIIYSNLIEMAHNMRYINMMKILLDEDTCNIGGKITLGYFAHIWHGQVMPIVRDDTLWYKRYDHPSSIMYTSDYVLLSDYTGIVRRNSSNESHTIYKNRNPIFTIDNKLYWVSFSDYQSIHYLDNISLDAFVKEIEFEEYNKRIQNGECLRRYDDDR